ncbi:MAG: ATP-binding cassette domain-containing protein, partial [Acidimicrobiales bacterium]
SLGQFAFAGIGGVVAGDLIVKANLVFFVSIACAAIAGAVLAILVGLPALRIKGMFLAVTTLALAVAVDSFFLNPTNFPSAIPQGFLRPVLWKRFDLASGKAYYFFCLAILLLVVVFVKGLRRARAGRVLLANRDNQNAASAMAVASIRVKLVGFVLAGAIAGIGGALYATSLRAVGFATFDSSLSLVVFSMAVIGGLESISGALLGVALIEIGSDAFPQYQLLITGTGLLVVLMILPGGLGAGIQYVRDRVLRVVAERRHLLVPSLVADRRVVSADDSPGAHAPREDSLLAAALSVDPPVADGIGIGRDSTNGPGASGPRPHDVPDVLAIPDAGEPTGELENALGTESSNARALALRCRGVEVSYGPVQILFGVDLDVVEGEIVALLGTNGAGKSTLLKGITGLAKVGGGSVELGGKKITNIAPDATAHLGLSLMPGGRGVFPTLTVEENLRLGAWLIRKRHGAAAEARRRVTSLFPILENRSDQQAGNLSGGEQQMLSLAMALMVTPKVLMIDELSLGLAPTIVAQLMDVVQMLHRGGTTIVVVEQSVNVALELAERAVFLEKGEVRFSGPTAELLERPDILRSVFIAGASAVTAEGAGGEAIHTGQAETSTNGSLAADPAFALGGHIRARVAPDAHAPVVLECHGVIKRFGGITAVNDVHIGLRDGEILGLIGHNGAGKTTLFDLMSGFLPLDGGQILLGGMNIGTWPAHMRATAGLGRTFQEARLFPSLTVQETIAVALERHLASRDLIAAGLRLPASLDSEFDARLKVDELVTLMGLGAFAEKLVGELSTGTRRIVELACVLAQDPAVLMLDEPSGGVAQRETEAMGPLLQRVQLHSGCSILVVEHDMPLLTAICDRMIALELGEVIAEGTPAEVLDHPQVVESYLGTKDSAIQRSGVGASHSLA